MRVLSKIQDERALPEAVGAEGVPARELDWIGPLAQADAALILHAVHQREGRTRLSSRVVATPAFCDFCVQPQRSGERRDKTPPDHAAVRRFLERNDLKPTRDLPTRQGHTKCALILFSSGMLCCLLAVSECYLHSNLASSRRRPTRDERGRVV